jgi:hypothetical protein
MSRTMCASTYCDLGLGQVEDALDLLAVAPDEPVRVLGGELRFVAGALDLDPEPALEALLPGVLEHREQVVRQPVAGLPVAGGVPPVLAHVAEPAGVHHEQLAADRRR